MIKSRDKLKSELRQLSLSEESPVIHQGNRWKVKDRISVWQKVAPQIFNEHLDRFAEVAIEVLGERNLQFDLEKDERYMALLYGKTFTHSSNIRRGIAETLALIGTHAEDLKSVSPSKPDEVTRLVIRTLLAGKSWKAWASLDDLLPLIAEASPELYLTIIEQALKPKDAPFFEIFKQETSGITSKIYMSGLLWSLEGLAWDCDYLGRVVLALGELATIDPGGNYANRPANSLVTILLPWFPQTLAPVVNRIAAVKALRLEYPEVSWSLILKLLPGSQQSSSMTHKPEFRELIPDHWKEGTNNEDYWSQIQAYSELAVEQAFEDKNKIPVLIDYLGKLTKSSMEKFLDFLSSVEVAELPGEIKLLIWNELFDFIIQNKKYAEAKWAAPSEIVQRIENIAEKLEPKSASEKFQRLFVGREFDLYEQKDDFDAARKILSEKRIDAAHVIFRETGLRGLLDFVGLVELPENVGAALAFSRDEKIDNEILPALLEDDRNSVVAFTYGYVRSRFQSGGGNWVKNLNVGNWSNNQHALFLALLPFVPEIWELAELLPDGAAKIYWERSSPNPFESKIDFSFPVDRLLGVGRRVAAVNLLDGMRFHKMKPNSEQIVKVLESLDQDEISRIGAHTLVELISSVQAEPETNKNDLLRIEWRYLGILDGSFGGNATELEKALATDASFFCEVIRAVFRSKDIDGDKPKAEERSESVAMNGYRLLKNWKIPPGTLTEQGLDGDFLEAWLFEVKSQCAESGHLDIAMEQVGGVLFYSPPDPSGLWLHMAAAKILNARDAEHLRIGFRTEIFNSRGVHFVDPEGKPEQELANHYRKQAADLELAGFIRLSGTLRDLARDYDREAERIRAQTTHE